jgi:hypothetical protein
LMTALSVMKTNRTGPKNFLVFKAAPYRVFIIIIVIITDYAT